MELPGEKHFPEVRAANDDAYVVDDITLSRQHPRLLSQESEEVPVKVAEQLLHEVDEFLAERVPSKPELEFLLNKIDAARAINNDPKAMQMREDLIRKFGDDARE